MWAHARADQGGAAWQPLPARALGGCVFRLEEVPAGSTEAELRAADEVLCERRSLGPGEPRWVVLRRIEAGWSVWREDDHGRRVEVDRALSHGAAIALAERLESGGHKQRYWIAPSGEAQ